jgi:hypothetical protein
MGNTDSKEQIKEENRNKSPNKIQQAGDSSNKTIIKELPLSELELLDIDLLKSVVVNAEKYDLDQKNNQLMKRWEAIHKIRSSYWEAIIAKIALGDNWQVRYSNMLLGKCPLSFPDVDTWIQFSSELAEVLKAENLSGWFGLRGSGTTFISMHPEKGIDPDHLKLIESYKIDPTLKEYLKNIHFFDCKVHNLGGPDKVRATMKEYQQLETFSDLDFNIKSPQLIERLKKKGAKPSSSSVGGNYNQDDTFDEIPGLWSLKANWTPILQRDISIVSVSNPNANINSYSKHPFTFAI